MIFTPTFTPTLPLVWRGFHWTALDEVIYKKQYKTVIYDELLFFPGLCWKCCYLYGVQVVGGSNPLAPTI